MHLSGNYLHYHFRPTSNLFTFFMNLLLSNSPTHCFPLLSQCLYFHQPNDPPPNHFVPSPLLFVIKYLLLRIDVNAFLSHCLPLPWTYSLSNPLLIPHTYAILYKMTFPHKMVLTHHFFIPTPIAVRFLNWQVFYPLHCLWPPSPLLSTSQCP